MDKMCLMGIYDKITHMASVYTQQSSNVAKTYLLMGIFLVVIAGLGYFVSFYYNNPGIFYIAIILVFL